MARSGWKTIGGIVAAVALLGLATGCYDPRQITSAEGDMAVVVDGNNRLALNLYEAARGEDGNLFFSPFSINAALSMTYAGAQGQTEVQMADLLGVELAEEAWHENLAALFADISGVHYRGYTLHTANAVWGQSGVPFKRAYTGLLADTYGAPLEQLDFIADAASALKEINDWVSDQTKGHVPALFESSDIDRATRLVLVNAVYFEADWASRFAVGDTTDGDFWTAPDRSVRVPMMTQKSDLGYAHGDGVGLLELPYEDDELSMVVLLPDDRDGLATLEQNLTYEDLQRWIDAIAVQEMDVTFPRFELSDSLPLSAMLQELGMADAFDCQVADFTGMVDAGDMDDNYCIKSTRHKATVQVDEAGTTATAATGVAVGIITATGGPTRFVADHPFLFVIRDMLTGTILFVGRLVDPADQD